MYLILNDYLRIIQPNELNAITSSQPVIRVLQEGSTEDEIRSYLVQRFNLDREFQSTDPFSYTSVYKATNRVYLDAPAYDPLAGIYILNQLTLQAGLIYFCSVAIPAPEVFTIAHWTLLGSQYDLFYVDFPFPEFQQNFLYPISIPIWWNDKTYASQVPSTQDTHEDDLQDGYIENIPQGNVLPDDKNTSAALRMWGTGLPYSFSGIWPTNIVTTAWSNSTAYVTGNYSSQAGTNYIAVAPSTNVQPGTDITKWVPIVWKKGDNRNRLIVKKYMDMVVYALCARIAPNNVPEARHNAWLQAISDLKAFAKGDRTASLPIIQPKQGKPIRFGGNVSRNNNW